MPTDHLQVVREVSGPGSGPYLNPMILSDLTLSRTT